MATRAPAATVCQQFAVTAEARAGDVAIRTRDSSIAWTWAQYAERARRAALGLAGLGIGRHDVVGCWMRNRPAFHVVDAGAMLLGALTTSIHTQADDSHAAHVIRDSGCRVLVTEPAFLGAALTLRNAPDTALQTIVLIDGDAPGTLSWDAVLDAGAPGFDLAAATAAVRPEDPLTLVYTAGTTGPARGVLITHANVAAQTAALTVALGLDGSGRVVSFLPMAAIAERLCSQYLPIALGWEVTCCPDPALVGVFLRETQPTFFFAPPRTWEALKSAVMARIDNAEALRALEAASGRIALERAGEEVPEELVAACRAADQAFFTPLRARLGVDRTRHAIVGAAPASEELSGFFAAIGLPLTEVYGLTETAGAATFRAGGGRRDGQVGLPLPGAELRLSARGEILVRAPFVAAEYRDGPGSVVPVVDDDGWLATGDIGTLESDGSLRVTDRVDAQIHRRDGRAIAPTAVEDALRRASPLVGHACVVGDSRPFPVALLTLDVSGVREWARDHGLRVRDLGVLADHPEVLGAVAAGVARANAELPEHERVRRFLLLGAPWRPGGDEVTPTMKLRRSLIAAKYAPEIEALYDGDGVEPAVI